MTAGALSPGFIQVEYHSQFAPHLMTLPVNTPIIDTGTPSASLITQWDAGTIVWRTMLEDLLETLVPQFSATVIFDRGTLFTQADADSLAFPQDSYTFVAISGTATPPGWEEATQQTIVFRDTSFNIVKLVQVDFASGNNFGKFRDATAPGLDDLVAEFTNEAKGWSSRKNARPNLFLSATRTINEKLRRSYRLT